MVTETKPLRVVMVIENLMGGGAQLFALRLAEALKRKGVDVCIVLLFAHLENKELTGLFPSVPVVGLRLPMRRVFAYIDNWLFRFRFDLSFLEYFQGILLKQKGLKEATVVHTHYIKTDYQISRLLQRTKVAHVVSVHGDYSHQYNHYKKHGRAIWNRLNEKLQYLVSEVDKWVIVSEEQRRFFTELFRVPAEKISKVYYGYAVPSEKHLKLNQSSANIFTIGMLARGVPEKGWEILINAFLQLPSHCRLLLGGDSPYLQTLARTYAAEPRITFAGHQQDVLSFIGQCDVMTLPSHTKTESLPYSVIESLAAGKPVVASDIGEIKQMLTTDEGEIAGIVLPLVNGRVTDQSLYEVLLLFVNNETFLAQKTSLAKKAFEKFDMEACVQAYLKIYREQNKNIKA